MFARSLGLWFLLLLCNTDYAQTWKYDLQLDSLTRDQKDKNSFEFSSQGKKGYFSAGVGVLLEAGAYDEIRASPKELDRWPDEYASGLNYLAVRKGKKWAVYRVLNSREGKIGEFRLPPGSKQTFVFDSISFPTYGTAVGHWKKRQETFSVYDEEGEMYDREVAEAYTDAVPAFDEGATPGTYLARQALRRINAEYRIKEAAGSYTYIFTFNYAQGVYDALKNRILIEPIYYRIHYKGGNYYCEILSTDRSIAVVNSSGEVRIPRMVASDFFYWQGLEKYGMIAGKMDDKFVILDSNLNVKYSSSKRMICSQQGNVPSIFILQDKKKTQCFSLVSGKIIQHKMENLLFETPAFETVFRDGSRYALYDPRHNKTFVLPFEKMYQQHNLILGISKGRVSPLKWVSAKKQTNLELYDSINLLLLGYIEAPGMKRKAMIQTQFMPKYFQTYRNGKCGLIDAKGNLILPPECDSIVWNAELSGNSKKANFSYLILRDGAWSLCAPEPYIPRGTGFSEIRMYAGYYFIDYMVHGPKGWNIYNLNDGYMLSQEAEAIEPIHQSCYRIKYPDGYHLFPMHSGTNILTTKAYDSIWIHDKRLILMQKNGYMGMLKNNGDELIAPECDSIDVESGASNGIVYTYRNGKAGFYYRRNREKEVWDQVLMGENRLVWTQLNGKWGVVLSMSTNGW